MTESSSSREITDYLRGLAIVLVMITHYSGTYDPDYYAHYLSNYGNAFMAIFFILAGYGAFYSAEKRFSGKDFGFRFFLRYFMDRALRIYPLYWVALALTAILEPQYFPIGDYGIGQILAIAVALPFVTTPFWFISSIIQCYFFSPFLYLILKKIGSKKYVFFNIAFLAILLVITQEYAYLLAKFQSKISITIPDPNVTLFRGVFLGNVFLFSLGLMLPSLVRTYEVIMKKWVVFSISVLVLLTTSYILRYDVLELKRDELLMEIVYYFSVFFFCWSMIAFKPKLPQRGVVTLLGRYSYSLYLFHALLFQILIFVNLFQEPLPLSLAIVLVLFPALLWFCIYSERSSRAFRTRIWRLGKRAFQPGSTGGPATP